MSRADACEKMEVWRRYYNEERPHSAIGNIPPITLVNSDGETSPRCREIDEKLWPSVAEGWVAEQLENRLTLNAGLFRGAGQNQPLRLSYAEG